MTRSWLSPLLLVCLAANPALPAEAPLARLAASFADEIVRVAGKRAVELGPVEDRSGRGAAFALDLRNLVLSRLGGRVALGDAGPRLRIEPVLTETSRQLIVSARVVAEPGGSLVDLLTASVAKDEALLALYSTPTRAAPVTVDLLSGTQTPPLDGPVLDLVLLSDDRLLVLGEDSISIYRFESGGLVQEARRELPGPLDTVRTPGGRLVPAEDAVWAITSRTPGATLFALAGSRRRLEERSRSAALPIPGSPEGLRYRPGTNLLQGTLPGLGPGPFLAFALSDPRIAVDAEGRLQLASPDGPHDTGLRVGPALAALWPGVLAAASAAPPGPVDQVLLIGREGSDLKVLETLPVQGAVRALAARPRADGARVVAAVEEGTTTRLLVLDLRRVSP